MKYRKYHYRGYTITRQNGNGRFIIVERPKVGDFHYLYNVKQFIDQLYVNAFLERIKNILYANTTDE